VDLARELIRDAERLVKAANACCVALERLAKPAKAREGERWREVASGATAVRGIFRAWFAVATHLQSQASALGTPGAARGARAALESARAALDAVPLVESVQRCGSALLASLRCFRTAAATLETTRSIADLGLARLSDAAERLDGVA
jgi:hypothetical protein